MYIKLEGSVLLVSYYQAILLAPYQPVPGIRERMKSSLFGYSHRTKTLVSDKKGAIICNRQDQSSRLSDKAEPSISPAI